MLEQKIEIETLIYEVRGKQVMIDSDVAYLYGYETKHINQTTKRNVKRFPEEFFFRLTLIEYNKLIKERSRPQFVTLNVDPKRGSNVKYLPYVFTEQGIAMLSSLLKNDIAIKVSINIMKAFVDMRKFINANKYVFERVISIENKIDSKFLEYDINLKMFLMFLNKKKNLSKRSF